MALLRRKSSGSSSSSSSPFLSSGKIVSDVPPAPRPPLRRLSKRSSVGPGTVSHCLDNLLAKIDCEILQPTPDFTHLNEQVRGKVATSGQGKGSGCMSDMSENCTLLPSGRRTLCLWFDPQEKEYHLTAIKLDKDEVFLDLPLSGIRTGSLKYNPNKQWHEVTCDDNSTSHPRRFVFSLKPEEDNSKQARDFNAKLEAVFEEIIRAADPAAANAEEGERKEEEVAVLSPLGKEVVQEMTSEGLLQSKRRQASSAMATVQSKGPSLRNGTEVPLVAAGDVAAGLPVNRSQASMASSETQQMCEALTLAIQAGDVHRAQELVFMLTQSRTPVNIGFDAAAEERKAREQEISVTVHVEDRESAGLTLPDIKVKPSDTILDIKRRFMIKYSFPLEVQKWIIGKRICGDEETLSKCDVNSAGHTLYLYLLNARSVNIKREDYWRQQQFVQPPAQPPPPGVSLPGASNTAAGSAQHHSSDYESMYFPVGPNAQGQTVPSSNQLLRQGQGQGQGQGGAERQQSHISAASSSSSLASTSFGLSAVRSGADLRAGNFDPVAAPPSAQRVIEGRQGEGQGGTLVAAAGEASQTVLTAEGGAEDRLGVRSAPDDVVMGEPEGMLQGWQCVTCTLINQPTRPGCEACGSARPADYQVPSTFVVSEEERQRLERERELEALMQEQIAEERQQNYQRLLQVDSNDLVTNTQPFDCPICFDSIQQGEGIMLRECLHQFCRSCLVDTVRLTEEAELKCPFQDENYRCDATLQDREVRALVSDQVYERYLRRSLDTAESQASNSYHCKTPDCHGWCLYEDLVNFFRCPVCRHENCLTCRAIHEGMDCKQYQEDLRIRASNDKAAQQTQVMLQSMLEKGEAMPCPQCQVIVQKKDGCDWIRCSICKTEICWVTKGPRWGPKGEGDTSGGCKCRVEGRKCHPKCNNCH